MGEHDLISRAALLEKVHLCKESVSACANHDYLVGYASALSGVEGQIATEPTVDAEPVRHGYWIEDGPNWVCSYCGTEFKDELEFIEGAGDYYMPHYCPHCGAKMDGEIECSDG